MNYLKCLILTLCVLCCFSCAMSMENAKESVQPETKNLASLDAELLENVCLYLKACDIYHISLVSKDLYTLAKPLFWHIKFVRQRRNWIDSNWIDSRSVTSVVDPSLGFH